MEIVHLNVSAKKKVSINKEKYSLNLLFIGYQIFVQWTNLKKRNGSIKNQNTYLFPFLQASDGSKKEKR